MEIFSPKTIAALEWLLPKITRVAAPLIAFVITPLAAFVVIENWRGNHAWQAMQDDWKARGEPLEWSAHQPRPVPDEQNFFKGPPAARMLDLVGHGRPDAEQLLRNIHLNRLFDADVDATPGDWRVAIGQLKKTGLLATDYAGSPAAGVLLALQPAKPFLDELRDAARDRDAAARPLTANPLVFFTGVSMAVFQPVRALCVRAQVELELGQNEAAFADTIALACIARHLAGRPTLFINLSLAERAQALAIGVINAGCRRHAWDGAQVAALQTQLGRFNLFALYRECLLTEQVVISYVLDSSPSASVDPKNPRPWWMFHGWTQQNKVAWGHHIEREVLSAFAVNPDRVFLDKIEALRQATETLQHAHSPYEWLSRFALASHGDLIVTFGQQVEKAQQSIIFCALERYRLAHGDYPDRLEQLTAAFLPTVPPDVFSGQPRRYVKLPAGGHQLYSVGKNGRDDGGMGDDIVLKLTDGS